ncbi:MAG: hypothetical protein N2203_07945 [Bacteroidia bacterium]|nr:hypothetical protein [Bacteroidia bacterium]
MKKTLLVLGITFELLVGNKNAWSQNVGVNSTGAMPHPSAGLDVNYTNKGVLIPRVSLSSITDAVTIPGAANSLLVYNTNAGITGGCGTGYYYWNGSQWVCFLTSPGSGGGSSMAWLTNGNVGTNSAVNFLGTIDNQNLIIKTNNFERARFLNGAANAGGMEIGSINPVNGRALLVVGSGNAVHTASFRNSTGYGIALGSMSNAPFNTVGSIQAFDNTGASPTPLVMQTAMSGSASAVCIGTVAPLSWPGGAVKTHIEGAANGIALYAHVPSGAGISGETNGSGGGNNGVEGYAWNSGSSSATTGMLGYSDGLNGNGVYGECSNGTAFPLGLWGVSKRGSPNADGYTNTNGYAGYFGLASTANSGFVRVLSNLEVVGTVSKGGGSFLIDHPLDPENKYLYHSFVESPDMMNIYNGNIITDANGEAIVKLPDYFMALNKDYRYQLTPIGQFAQCIVLKEIENNQFVIKTDKPNVKVSWQVTGIRQDPFANMYRIIPEVEKKSEEKGYYLHPECYGKPRSKFIDNAYKQSQPKLKRFADSKK